VQINLLDLLRNWLVKMRWQILPALKSGYGKSVVSHVERS